LIRSLLNDYYPKQKPPKEFYDVITELRKIGVNLNQVAHIANITHLIDKQKYSNIVISLKQLINEIKEKYL